MSKKAKWVLIAAVALLAIAAAIVLLVTHNKPETDNTKSILNEKIVLNGLEIQELYSYSGKFVEDGSDKKVKNTLAAKVKNCTGRDIEYAEIELAYGGGMYSFSVSALPAGKTAQLIEMNMAACPEASDDVQANLVYLVSYEKPLSLNENAIAIEGNKGSLTLKNISEADISGSIIVCYKNVSDGEYLGGIAYRAKIDTGLAAGASVILNANHFNPDASEIIFVSYGQ